MITVEKSIVLDRPVEDVFAFRSFGRVAHVRPSGTATLRPDCGNARMVGTINVE